jgi:hypothetical protein
MPKYLEWDFDNPKHRQRRGRPPPPLEGDVLPPEDKSPAPRIRVEVRHHYQPRQRQAAPVPPWVIVLAIFAALTWVTPLGVVVAVFMGAILVMAHPTIAIAALVVVAILAIAAWRNHRRGLPF